MDLIQQALQKQSEDEEQPIGIIFCTGANRHMVELMGMDKAGITVSEFRTELPPKEQFEHRLQEIMAEARERLERRRLQGTGENPKQLQYFIEPKDHPDED